MEFKFNLDDIFKNTISKINHSLIPSGFSGDRRDAAHCAELVASVLDGMGYASAKAQSLQQMITSADKLRNSEHIVYLMIEPDDFDWWTLDGRILWIDSNGKKGVATRMSDLNGGSRDAGNNGKGSVVGLLKIGFKNLFLFDETGMVHEKKCLCILDFYVHESKQRTGYGKKMYDYMLQDMEIAPCELAIDKPSENFLSFLYKHYGLDKIYPQNNNFVLFEGFFDDKTNNVRAARSETVSNQGSTTNIEQHSHYGLDNNAFVQSVDYLPTAHGRHSAFKPYDTMGTKLVGNSSTQLHPQQTKVPHRITAHTALW